MALNASLSGTELYLPFLSHTAVISPLYSLLLLILPIFFSISHSPTLNCLILFLKALLLAEVCPSGPHLRLLPTSLCAKNHHLQLLPFSNSPSIIITAVCSRQTSVSMQLGTNTGLRKMRILFKVQRKLGF